MVLHSSQTHTHLFLRQGVTYLLAGFWINFWVRFIKWAKYNCYVILKNTYLWSFSSHYKSLSGDIQSYQRATFLYGFDCLSVRQFFYKWKELFCARLCIWEVLNFVSFNPFLYLSLSLSLSNTHTHTHTKTLSLSLTWKIEFMQIIEKKERQTKKIQLLR